MISFAFPTTPVLPFCKSITLLSRNRAWLGLWEERIKVFPQSSAIFFMIDSTVCWFLISSAEVGSSSITISVSWIMAEQIETICLSPPLISPSFLSNRWVIWNPSNMPPKKLHWKQNSNLADMFFFPINPTRIL